MSEQAVESGPLVKEGSLPKVGPEVSRIGPHEVVGGFQRLSANLFALVRTENGMGVAKIGFSSPDDLRQFVHEAAMYRRAKDIWPYGNVNAIPDVHDNLTVQLPDEHGTLQEHPVLITEYVPSKKNLFTYIDKNGPLAMRSAINRIYPFALGLEALRYARIVHRDIKPENVFMHNGFGRLADFGLAVDEGYKEESGFVYGTKGYLSPEHRRMDTLTNSANIWGLGAVMYFAVTGEHLIPRSVANNDDLYYKKDSYDAYIAERMKFLPPYYRNIFTKVVAYNPKDRYDTATDFMIALDTAEKRRKVGSKHRGELRDHVPARMRPPGRPHLDIHH